MSVENSPGHVKADLLYHQESHVVQRFPVPASPGRPVITDIIKS